MVRIGFAIILLATVAGVVALVPAYAPPLDRPDQDLVGLTLNDPAGARERADGTVVPQLETGTVLTGEHLRALREAGVERVRVKEFAFGRWSEGWLFAVACLGLLAGAALVRRGGGAEPAAAAAADRGTAAELLQQVAGSVDRLRQEVTEAADPDAAGRRILAVVGTLQQEQLAAFPARRPELEAHGGLTHYARVMDGFAGAERQLNRAWSAAADGVLAEARDALDQAADLLEETRARLV
jgi:hypothetical protein